MKNIYLFSLLIFNVNISFSQITFSLTIKDTQRKPLVNTVVEAKHTSLPILLSQNTDQNGTVVFELFEAGMYTFNYLTVKNAATYEVLEGYKGEANRTIVYDPEGIFAEKPAGDRSGIQFKIVDGKILKGKENMAKVTVLVHDKNRKPVSGVDLAVVTLTGKIKFTGRSNANGEAFFYLPISQQYEIDVAEMAGFKIFEVPNYRGIEMKETVFYEKLDIVEKFKGDTILQSKIHQTTGTSSHVLFSLTLNDYNGKPLEGEPVYAKAENSNRVYEGLTDDNGQCKFMVQKGDNYVLNLKHENGIHLIKAQNSKGFRTAACTRAYRGSAIIEEMLAEQKAEMEAIAEQIKEEALRPKPGDENFPISFKSTPVQKLTAPTDYLKQTKYGLQIDFEESGDVGTPTLIDNHLYSQVGLYSTKYFCLDAQNGHFKWGLELHEGGISPAVYSNGIILINTASCSLYAIDAKTGELLWSKWLASYVYSTPSADEENVFVVYQHGGYPVLVSFKLKTGEFNWMQRIDNEAIACPVIANNEVHVVSQSGLYYIFNKENGQKKVMTSKLKFISSPTVTTENIYIAANIANREYLVAIDPKTLAIKKKFSIYLNAESISGIRNQDLTDQMNFNGSHPINYKNEIIVLCDKDRLLAFNAQTEKLMWSKSIKCKPDQIPIVANERIILTNTNGDVKSFDLNTGNETIITSVQGHVEGQPIAQKGIIYLPVGGVIMMVKTLKGFNWNQWNKDASHNLYWE